MLRYMYLPSVNDNCLGVKDNCQITKLNLVWLGKLLSLAAEVLCPSVPPLHQGANL